MVFWKISIIIIIFLRTQSKPYIYMQNAAELGSFPETLGAVLIMNIAVEWSEFLKFAYMYMYYVYMYSFKSI